MRALRLRLLVMSLLASVAAGAQTTAPAKAAAVQPALAALAAHHAADLYAAGVQQIVASSGKQWLDIQILTSYGASYIRWPKGMTPAPFELEVGAGGALTVRAEGDSGTDKGRYAAAFDAVLPEAIRLANASRTRAHRPRP